LEYGADVNAQNRYGITPLLIALDTNNLEIVEVLPQAGAGLGIEDGEGTLPEILHGLESPKLCEWWRSAFARRWDQCCVER